MPTISAVVIGIRKRLSACAGVALAVVLSACGASSAEPSSVASGAELAGRFGTISGGQIDLGSLQGQDVVLWFWAPW